MIPVSTYGTRPSFGTNSLYVVYKRESETFNLIRNISFICLTINSLILLLVYKLPTDLLGKDSSVIDLRLPTLLWLIRFHNKDPSFLLFNHGFFTDPLQLLTLSVHPPQTRPGRPAMTSSQVSWG